MESKEGSALQHDLMAQDPETPWHLHAIWRLSDTIWGGDIIPKLSIIVKSYRVMDRQTDKHISCQKAPRFVSFCWSDLIFHRSPTRKQFQPCRNNK